MSMEFVQYDYNLSYLVSGVSLILGFVFLLTRTKLIRFLILNEKATFPEKLLQALFFGLIGILGTYSGFYTSDGITNNRAIGIVTGGLIGGPLVGVGAGLIAGMNRLALGGLTVYTSALAAVLEGLLAGLLATNFRRLHTRWPAALLVGFILETLHMIILLFSSPFERSLHFVETIAPFMLITDPLGIAIFMALLDNLRAQQLLLQGNAAYLALKIAEQTLHFLRSGLNEASAAVTAQTILKHAANLDAVAIQSSQKILSLIHRDTKLNPNTEDSLPYETSIRAPLTNKDTTIGTLVFYKKNRNSITPFEIELIKGLGQLISTQIEVSNVEQQAALRAQAEIKALQAQINPHFLFNALNTIVYYCRKEPEQARELLLSLGEFYRNNLSDLEHFVDLHTELQHVESYVKIESARFQGKLQVIYDVPDEIKFLVPPLILQPIVENAIKHGLYPKKRGGKITIRYESQEEAQWLIVEDDGIGMSEELIATSLRPDPKRKSIGLSNVHQRLQTIYGLQYGLRIISVMGEGTKVIIPFPLKGVH